MRLPVRHPPPERDAPLARCAFLEALAAGSLGLSLGSSASDVGGDRDRGRHGNALQWHLGLEARDSAARLDWEDRIEIKLVSVWRRPGGGVALDKLKVCEATVDPRHKLSNVLFVFADRLTRVVIGYRFFRLAGEAREDLCAGWSCDPHFDRPPIYVEARESRGVAAPAYYLAPEWLGRWVVPQLELGLFPFDPRWWSAVRADHGGRAPLLTVVPPGSGTPLACGRCGASLHFDGAALVREGWAPARHGLPLDELCGLRGHAVIDGGRLARAASCSLSEQISAIERRRGGAGGFRLADRVAEPDDHEH